MGKRIRNVYIVHHSHTDVGYTDLQERVIYNQAQNIRTAVELIKRGETEGLPLKNAKRPTAWNGFSRSPPPKKRGISSGW